MRGRKPKDYQVACEATGCETEFFPDRVTQRYCSTLCKWRSRDAEARRVRDRGYYAADPSRAKHRAELAKAKKKLAIRALKEAPCTDCGQEYPYYVMDFDHVRGEKRQSLGEMLNSGYAMKALLEEVAKCELVCANCHRQRTFTRLGKDVI